MNAVNSLIFLVLSWLLYVYYKVIFCLQKIFSKLTIFVCRCNLFFRPLHNEVSGFLYFHPRAHIRSDDVLFESISRGLFMAMGHRGGWEGGSSCWCWIELSLQSSQSSVYKIKSWSSMWLSGLTFHPQELDLVIANIQDSDSLSHV